MPTWNEINEEMDRSQSPTAPDDIRHKYLAQLSRRTGRPVIAYYSSFLSKRDPNGQIHAECAISDLDMNGFMAVVHNLDRGNGLDLVLHTPGGGIEAGRSIVEYLYKMFGRKIRVIVPHMAMSVGTMIACAAEEIVLGKHSCLGPTDPQIRGFPAMGVLAEVDRAIEEIKQEPIKQLIWQSVFAKYPPAFILDCERSVTGARAMVKHWLAANMLRDAADPDAAAEKVVASLMNYSETTEHGHHFLIDKCIEFGLKIKPLESDQGLQEDVLSVHHSYMASAVRTNALKFIDNSSKGSWNVTGQ